MNNDRRIQPLNWNSLYCGEMIARPRHHMRWQRAAFSVHALLFLAGMIALWTLEGGLALTITLSLGWTAALLLHSHLLRWRLQRLRALIGQIEREGRWQRRRAQVDDYHFVRLPDDGDLFDRPPHPQLGD